MTVNRQCSSGLQAVANVVSAIKNGYYEIGIGGGVESMTQHYGPQALNMNVSEKIMAYQPAADCLLPMGATSENVAEQFGVGRVKQDQFALFSHKKAAVAQEKGLFKEEIVPVKVNGDGGVVDADDGIRRDVSIEGLSKLKTVFKENGTTTAGNASQVSDGAAAVLLMKRKTAEKLGLSIIGKFVSFAVAGVPPKIMGIGPAVAIPEALQKANLSVKDIDVYELNEAFASQAVYCIEKLGLDPNKVNPKGGAIALGHPLGCTGARQIATLLPELRRLKGRLGVVSMCIGTGMGAAAVIENELL
jgi:acetyl-CoA acyltransferase 1